MKTLNLIVAALGGAAVGAAAALLLAPEKGEVTRREIADFVRKNCPFEKKDKLDEIVDKIAEEIKK